MPFITGLTGFGITLSIRKKLMEISTAAIDLVLKKDKAALALKMTFQTGFASVHSPQ
jgi:hypothetical protein